jgi:hypothetical protein
MVSLEGLVLSIALGTNQYTDEKGPPPEPAFSVQVGHEESPIYAFAGYEVIDVRMLGQGIGDTSVFSLGIGAKHKFGNGFHVFGELGWGFTDQSPNMIIQQEIVYTELVGRHNVYNRPVPLDLTGPYDQDSYETVWEVEDDFLGAIGGGYEWDNGVFISGAYRPFYVREHIEVYDQERRDNGGGWWQETRSLDLSAFQLRVGYTF